MPVVCLFSSSFNGAVVVMKVYGSGTAAGLHRMEM
jgi:hypothetical protein